MPNPVHFPLWQHPIVDREGHAVLDFQETMNELFRQIIQLENTAASTAISTEATITALRERADAAENTAAELAQTVTDLRDDLTALQETVAGHHP